MNGIFNVGTKVKHKKYGLGTVVVNFGSASKVLFEDNNEKILANEYLERISNNEDSLAKPKYNLYQTLKHDVYGTCTVDKVLTTDMYVLVTSDGKRFIASEQELKETELNIIDEEELEEEEDFVSNFRIIPSNYSTQNYSTSAKRLLTHIRKKYTDEGIATIKSYEENRPDASSTLKGEIGTIVIPDKGIIVFKLIKEKYTYEQLEDKMLESILLYDYDAMKKYYVDNFMNSLNLVSIEYDEKVLKYPLRYVMVLQGVDLAEFSAEQKARFAIEHEDIYFKNFTSLLSDNDLFSNFEEHDSKFKRIDINHYDSIIERVVPENTTLVDIKPLKAIQTKLIRGVASFNPITGNEREYGAISLDDNQIKNINDTKEGVYLTLANPGTGKSVLLISKAYRIQSIEKDNHVLITCFNRNLKDHHILFAETNGFVTPNLHIKTFHKLAIDIVSEYDKGFASRFRYVTGDEYEYKSAKMQAYVDRFYELVMSGEVVTKFNAIFIDEVQLFEPKWIDICYKLLDRTYEDSYFFEMFGDINQDIKVQHSKGKASWQNATTLPSLQGRVRKLDINYRNTDIIANYLNSFITEFNKEMVKHNLPVDNECAALSSKAIRKGKLKTKILTSKQDDVSKIIQTVKELANKKKVDYRQIAIIYPATKLRYYQPIEMVKKELVRNNIRYNHIHGEEKTPIYECDGVILSTIDTCLGLDFDYVILCGLHFWDVGHDSDTKIWFDVDENDIFYTPEGRLHYNEVGKKIYSACSRARYGLYIIDDLNEDSAFKKLLRPECGRDYFNEK